MTTVGFIGLGHMGGPMARQVLDREYDLVVFDIDREAVESLVTEGATAADSPRELVERSDVVVLCLPSHREVEEVVLGEDGLLQYLEPDDVLIDTTTSSPDLSDRIEDLLRERGVAFLGAPVSGGRDGARNGTLTIMVGGDGEALDNCRPIFEAMASEVQHVGERASHGHAMKLLNNYLSYVNMIATTEATLAGRDIGLDLESMIRVINSSSGRNSWSEDKFPDEIVTEEYDLGADFRIAEKDIELARNFVTEHGPDFGVADVVRNSIQESSEELGAQTDLTRLYQFYESQLVDDSD
jgi:3-hydroxyisobutyrate dehydrogenase